EGIMAPTADGSGTKNRRSVWSINTDNTNGPHSETFPRELVRPCILAGTQPDDLVIDPFFGYGTVGLVCQEEQRRFLGIELNRNFVDAARERLVLDGESLFRTIRGGFRAL
ncbi:MAG: site-specific DNA-methyltransferase, partial [Chloroflexi bacterium]|nr:site-specific DNA-methyltransferase [Chloroflexota bacterium]